MLKVEHLQLKSHTGCVLLRDASFILPNTGFISIHGDRSELHHALAQTLAGIATPNEGTLIYNEEVMDTFDEVQRSMYRSTFVTSLFHDFQILKDKSVLENITMGLEYPQERLVQELKQWQLYAKRDDMAEDLSTQEQWKMILLQHMLRQPMMLIFDSESSSLSAKERQQFYHLLEQLSHKIAVVVIGDMGSYSFSQRIIEIEKAYILSDSYQETLMYPQINLNTDTFTLTRSNIEDLHDKIHDHIRWKLRCASLLCVAAFICLSTAVFSTTLNITDIQSRVMAKQGSSLIAIEKQAVGNDQKIIENYYDQLTTKDIHRLNEELHTDLILGYYPIDVKENMLTMYGTTQVDAMTNQATLDTYTIMEADDEHELGLRKLYGTYPQNYYQVALSSSQAYALLQDQLQEPYQNTEEQIEQMLGKSVTWYGNRFVISGIFPSQVPENVNMELDMTNYNGSSYTSGNIMQNSFFVKRGFTKEYPIMLQQVYQKSYKRMIYGSKIITEFDRLSALDTSVYYFDGKTICYDHALKEDEVLIDFAMALDMGFRSNYVNTLQEDQISYGQREQEYKKFAKSWIGRTIAIQTYTVADAPTSSTLMNKNVKIKGFMIPVSYAYTSLDVDYAQGSIYTNPSLIQGYEQNNMYIKGAFYHTDDEAQLNKALTYLNKEPIYHAYLSNSRILKFFVVDLKSITSFLFLAGIGAFFSYIGIYLYLLWSSIHHMRNECSVYYLFGLKQSDLSEIMMQYFHMILWMRSLFGWFCGTLALGTFILMIYFTLSASPSILWALALPLLLLVLCVVIIRLGLFTIQRKTSMIEEEFYDNGWKR